MRDRNDYHPGVKSPKMGTRGGFVRAEAECEQRGISPPTSPGTMPDGGGLRHAVMLAGALGFLITIGLVLPHGESGTAFRDWLLASSLFRPLMAGLWGIVVMEGLLGLFLAPDAWRKRLTRFLLTSLFPPARMIAASSTPTGWLWVPRAGWMPAGKTTLREFEQKAAMPMAILTFLVLPVLVVELTYGEALDKYPHLALATHLTTSAIWLGFTVEFLWMVAASPKRLTYCMQHWINLVIIFVPLAAFLRILNMLRLARVVRAGRLLRAYRLRGLSSRLWRLVMLFNLFERLQRRDPVKYCAALEAKIDDLEEEMAGLRAKLDAARKRIPPPKSSLPSPAPVGAGRREPAGK
ncbi:MAG: hypothetical protein RBS80_17620 [Thermoguttaceae bacterium]|jgi:voltage-gated potassium channel|nr:hypothetical protein [Thermoguttaceae bacterium]